MKILINTMPLSDPLTGVGHYVANLIDSLMALEPSYEYFFLYGNGVSPKLRSRQSETGEPVKAPFYRGVLPQSITWRLRRLFFTCHFLRSKYTLYHETNYFPPIEIPLPTVGTIYDLSVQLFPQYHPIGRVKMFEKHFMRNLPSYRYVITISENTKKDLIEVTGFPTERIHVAYPGCHSRFTVIGRTVVKRYLAIKKLPPRYILFLGTMDPRKNIRRLLESYALLSKRLRREYCLVLAGWEGWDYEGVIKTIDKLGIGSSIVYLGYVSDDETPLLYNGASLFVYPSIYEGFGLPPLEAMACGCPVITSNTSSLPEVVGEKGVMVDPYNEYDLRDKMEMILTDGRMSADLREYGLKRARVFSWETCAQKTLEIYNKAVE